MIFLFLLCLVRVESAPDLHSGAVDEVTSSYVSGISATRERAESGSRGTDEISPNRLLVSILRRLSRSAELDRDEMELKSLQLSPLGRFLQKLFDSAWVRPPISNYLTTVVIPGAVINHGKISNLGQLKLISVTNNRKDGGELRINVSLSHENLQTAYKYNLDGPKGRLVVTAPNRIYSINLSSKLEGSQCTTEISELALETEDDIEFSSEGESSEDLAPYMKFVGNVLTLESRRTAFFNIEAAIKRRLQTLKPPLCEDIN